MFIIGTISKMFLIHNNQRNENQNSVEIVLYPSQNGKDQLDNHQKMLEEFEGKEALIHW